MEPKFVRLKTPVSLGSRFGDWEVTWRRGWTRDRLSYPVMVGRVRLPVEQLNDGALSLRYVFHFAEGFVSTSRSNLAFGKHMISERHAGTEMACFNEVLPQTTVVAARLLRSLLKNDYVYQNDDHDSRRGPEGEEHQGSFFNTRQNQGC